MKIEKIEIEGFIVTFDAVRFYIFPQYIDG